jgi:hypothetical protein
MNKTHYNQNQVNNLNKYQNTLKNKIEEWCRVSASKNAN